MNTPKVSYTAIVFCCLVFLVLTGADAAELAIDDRVVVDSHGRRITVTAPFQRIISLYGAHTENLFMLGAQSRLIGVGRNEDWPPDAKKRPVHSYRDGLEKFMAARPDLVLIRPMIDRGYGRLVQSLESHGVTVVSLQPNTLEQMFVYWTILGKLCGRPSQARQMIVRFKEDAARLQGRTVSIELKKRVYFEAIHERMRTFAPAAMPIFVLETAGGVNVAADAVPRRGTNIADYGKERILAQSDKIDVYLAQVGPMNRPTVEMIKKEPGFGLIRAVQQDHIYFIDEKLVSRPTLRLLTGIYRIGQMLYPDIFSGEAESLGTVGQGGPETYHTYHKETQP
jgi:iron complex transport system substrate-binding protein